jgi:hypothetical protein
MMLSGRKKLLALAAAGLPVLAIAGSAGGAVIATGGDDERPITGSAFDEASRVALQHTKGGHVTGTEVGDEESFYEVEVTLDDGSQVDVQLDEGFKVVGDKVDNETESDADGQ